MAQGAVAVPVEPPTRRRAATIQQIASEMNLDEDSFVTALPARRPAEWDELKRKRLTLREHVYRIEGATETAIAETRSEREREVSMVCKLYFRRHCVHRMSPGGNYYGRRSGRPRSSSLCWGVAQSIVARF